MVSDFKYMLTALTTPVQFVPVSDTLPRNISPKSWVANAEVLKRERKSRAKQWKAHETEACVGESTENMNLTDAVAAAKKAASFWKFLLIWVPNGGYF